MFEQLVQSSHPIRFDERAGPHYEDGLLYIGMRAGPEVQPEHGVHELAHFIEMEDDRLGIINWGMRTEYESFPGYGTYQKERTTLAHAHREARVWAVQYILQNEMLDMPVSVEWLASSSVHLPDVWHLIGSDKAVQAWMGHKIKEYVGTYTLSGVEAEYARKVKLLETYRQIMENEDCHMVMEEK